MFNAELINLLIGANDGTEFFRHKKLWDTYKKLKKEIVEFFTRSTKTASSYKITGKKANLLTKISQSYL